MKKQEITELVNKNIIMLFLPGEETTTLARDKQLKNLLVLFVLSSMI